MVSPSCQNDRITKSKQKWYFEYSLPSDVHAVKKGFDVTKYAHENGGIDYKEGFWKKETRKKFIQFIVYINY